MTYVKQILIAAAIIGLGACAQVETRVDTHCHPGVACGGGPSTGAALPDKASGTKTPKPGPRAAVTHGGGRTFTPVSAVQVDAQGRMPARSAAPLPAELNKWVICKDPHCAPIRPVMPVGGTALMFSTPTTTSVVKLPSIDCERTPHCKRGVNPQTGVTAGIVDNGPFEHPYLKKN